MDQPSSPPIPIIQSHVKNMATLVNSDANTDNPLHTYHIQTGHLANEPPKQSEWGVETANREKVHPSGLNKVMMNM